MRAGLILTAAAVLVLGGCGRPPADPGQRVEQRPTPASAVTAAPRPNARPTPTPELAALRQSFTTLAAGHAGRLAVAFSPVGGGDPIVLGSLPDPVAWSTIKVPLAIAAERNDPKDRLRTTMLAAITESDNEAALALYQSLGGGIQARSAIDVVLKDYGDQTTSALTGQPTRDNFGEVQWRLDDQVRFASNLPCQPDGREVYAAMADVIADQSWGLGIFPGAHFKGGWGLSAQGTLVRQLGIIQTARGGVAVAMAYDSTDSDVAGFVVLTEVAQWVAQNVEKLAAGNCAGATPGPSVATAPLRTWTPPPTTYQPPTPAASTTRTATATRTPTRRPSTPAASATKRPATPQPSPARSTKR